MIRNQETWRPTFNSGGNVNSACPRSCSRVGQNLKGRFTIRVILDGDQSLPVRTHENRSPSLRKHLVHLEGLIRKLPDELSGLNVVIPFLIGIFHGFLTAAGDDNIGRGDALNARITIRISYRARERAPPDSEIIRSSDVEDRCLRW